MEIPIDQLISRLQEDLHNMSFISTCYEVVKVLYNHSKKGEAIEPILHLMETNPEVDFGLPGPLVSFLESFQGNGYEEKLIESLSRKPTDHTLWMRFNELDMVKTRKGFPEFGIKKGEVGTIIIAFSKPNEAYEVEFDDGSGRPKATFPILPDDIEKA